MNSKENGFDWRSRIATKYAEKKVDFSYAFISIVGDQRIWFLTKFPQDKLVPTKRS